MTRKQRRFVEEYLCDYNATAAAIRAGYSPDTAYSIGPELLKNPGVKSEIDKKLAETSRRTGISTERIIKEYARLAFIDPENLIDLDTGQIKETATKDDKAAIQAVKVKTTILPNGTQTVEREYKLADKQKALDALSKHLGINAADKKEILLNLPVVFEGEEGLPE